jgi:hypothetical protein
MADGLFGLLLAGLIAPVRLFILILAFLLVLLAAFNVGHPRINLAYLGLALFILTFMLTG